MEPGPLTRDELERWIAASRRNDADARIWLVQRMGGRLYGQRPASFDSRELAAMLLRAGVERSDLGM